LSRFKPGSNKYGSENSNSIVIKYLNDVDNKKSTTTTTTNLKATYSVQAIGNDQDDNQIADVIIESVAIVNDQGPTDVDISIISNHSSIVTESKSKLKSDFFIKPTHSKLQVILPPIQNEKFKEADVEMLDMHEDTLENIIRTSQNCDLLRSVLFTSENVDENKPPMSQSVNQRAFTPPVNEKSNFVLEQGYQYQDTSRKNERSRFLDESQNNNNDDVNISQFNADKSKFRSEFLQKLVLFDSLNEL
jgi:hypothetical protein